MSIFYGKKNEMTNYDCMPSFMSVKIILMTNVTKARQRITSWHILEKWSVFIWFKILLKCLWDRILWVGDDQLKILVTISNFVECLKTKLIKELKILYLFCEIVCYILFCIILLTRFNYFSRVLKWFSKWFSFIYCHNTN